MNILPKKRWHVLTKDNIERVRRDEEQAAAEEKERQRRIALAEQESRTALLRERARKRHHEDETGGTIATVEEGQKGNVNFFSEIEAGKKTWGVNKEHEEEKRLEKEKYEKKIGLLTYLGESAVETQKTSPWYSTIPKKQKKKEEEEDNDKAVDVKKKRMMDPMVEMEKYMKKKSKHKHKHKHKSRPESGTAKEKEKHKHKKHHKDKDKKSRKPSIEELRAERVRREAAERAKTNRLLSGQSDEGTSGGTEAIVDDRQRRYNSQYNPDFVRRKKPSWNFTEF
ncbi:leukocyte receptor cluster member 1 homolog [Ptychodera flava]|uniref:leukocyte receptor cluster member 1 homolog n=1 Tax=Ptychodera flava TaxID=63121 RepID=UPI003969CE90